MDLLERAKQFTIGSQNALYAGDTVASIVTRLRNEIEEHERKAFDAGWMAALNQHSGLLISHGVTDWSIRFHEAYRAFKDNK